MSWQPPQSPGYSGPTAYPPYPPSPMSRYPLGPGALGPAPGLEYASFLRRLGGYLIDVLVFAMPSVVLFLIVFGSTISAWSTQYNAAVSAGLTTPHLVLPASGLVAFGLIDCIASALYFGGLVSSWGSTVGQRAVGVRVVRQEDAGSRLPLGRAVARAVIWWGAALLSFVPVIGDVVGLAVLLALLWVIWDPRNQGLHDKLGRALVVRPSLLGAWAPAAYPYPGGPQYPYLGGPQYPSPGGPQPSPYPAPSPYPPSAYPPSPPATR